MAKIFKISPPRCGSTSLHQALEVLGYSSIHNAGRESTAMRNLVAGHADTLFEDYDCFMDFDWFSQSKLLLDTYPDAKFIHVSRDYNSWIASRVLHSAHFALTSNPNRILEINAGAEQWKQDWLQSDIAAQYLESASPGSVLRLDLRDGSFGWPALCGFLGKAEPPDSFPVSNQTAIAVQDINAYFQENYS